MNSTAKTPNAYVAALPEDRQHAVQKLRETLKANLPEGFEETMSYGMLGYVVPHSLYPSGYHVDPKLPLPFINLASQKNYIALYHMGIYADEKLLIWFKEAYKKQVSTKLDMGKSCVRFKKTTSIRYELIGELAAKISPQQWITFYEQSIQKKIDIYS